MACVGSIAQGYQNGRVALPERSDARRLTAELEASAAALRETQAANRKLAAELEVSMSELRESRARLMRAAIQERRRIERDLHDGVQQTLVAARVRLELAREAFREDPVRSEELFERVGADLGDALDELRLLARGVYPPVLSDQGLGAALRSAGRHSPLEVVVDPDGVGRYRPEIESAVYFCCLEALQNAAKHAVCASSVWITLTAGRNLRFEVTDDGAGFSVDGAAGGAGLTNMRDRLAAVAGRLEVTSAPGAGTCVVGTVPLGPRDLSEAGDPS